MQQRLVILLLLFYRCEALFRTKGFAPFAGPEALLYPTYSREAAPSQLHVLPGGPSDFDDRMRPPARCTASVRFTPPPTHPHNPTHPHAPPARTFRVSPPHRVMHPQRPVPEPESGGCPSHPCDACPLLALTAAIPAGPCGSSGIRTRCGGPRTVPSCKRSSERG